jgi:hypothetical protein
MVVNTEKIGKASAVPSKSVGRVESRRRFLSQSLVKPLLFGDFFARVGRLARLLSTGSFGRWERRKIRQVAVASNQPPVELPKLVVPPEITGQKRGGTTSRLPKLPVEGQLPETGKTAVARSSAEPASARDQCATEAGNKRRADSKPNSRGKPEQKSAERSQQI